MKTLCKSKTVDTWKRRHSRLQPFAKAERFLSLVKCRDQGVRRGGRGWKTKNIKQGGSGGGGPKRACIHTSQPLKTHRRRRRRRRRHTKHHHPSTHSLLLVIASSCHMPALFACAHHFDKAIPRASHTAFGCGWWRRRGGDDRFASGRTGGCRRFGGGFSTVSIGGAPFLFFILGAPALRRSGGVHLTRDQKRSAWLDG